MTIKGGAVAVEDGDVVAAAGLGSFIRRNK
jgi:hypothetical protein